MRRYQKIIFLQATLLSLPLSLSLRARRAWQSRSLMGLRSLSRAKRGISGFASASLRNRSAPRNDNPFILFLLVMICIVAFILIGITLMGPIEAYGQSKGRIILSQESGRDPFLLPSGVHLLSKIGTPLGVRGGPSGRDNKPDENLMKVKAILISDHARLALIDRHIVTVGDSIHGEKVLEIKTDRVVLGKRDQRRTLLLSQSPVRLTVEESPLHSYPSPQGGSEGRDKGE